MSNCKNDNLPTNYSYKPLHHGLTIKKSTVDGIGLFATKDLSPGKVLGPSHIKISAIAFKTEYDISKENENFKHFIKCSIDEQNRYLCMYHPHELIRTPLGGHINHCTDSNTVIVDRGTYFVLVTTRHIPAGEELLINYHESLCGTGKICTT